MSEVTESDSRTVLSGEEPDNHFSKMGLVSVVLAFVVGLALLLLGLSSASKSGLAIFTDIPSVQFVLGPIVWASLYLYFRHSVSIFQTMKVLGIPVALAGGMLGLHGILQGLQDPYAVGGAVALLLLCCFYGALVSAIGYFFCPNEDVPLSSKINGIDVLVSVLPFLLMMTLAMVSGVGISFFVNYGALALHVGMGLWAIFIRKDASKSVTHCLADSSLVGVLFILVIALIGWFQVSPDVDQMALSFGCLGMLYGTILYVACYFFSLKSGDTHKINFAIKNWHLVEANTFFIFLVFAPVNLGESMFNEIDDKKIEEMTQKQETLRSEIALLTERLAKLEDS